MALIEIAIIGILKQARARVGSLRSQKYR